MMPNPPLVDVSGLFLRKQWQDIPPTSPLILYGEVYENRFS